MKSAVPKAGLQGVSVVSTPPLSHIPLPRRKTSNKSDKGLDGDEADSELSSRGQAKTSLLSSTSFCCASGQKEDYLPDARIVPAVRPPKKRPPATKGTDAPSTPKSPLLSVGRGLLTRGRKGKVCPDSQEDIQVHMSENGIGKSAQEDIKLRPGGQYPDNRLRAVDDRRKITPPSPQRRFHSKESPAIARKDPIDIRKYSDDLRKLRKEFTSVPNQEPETAKKCNKHPNQQKLLDFSVGKNGSRLPPCPGAQEPEGCPEVLKKSHESDDFDCPCCDRTSVLMMDEGGLSDIEVKRFTSCEVIAPMECSLVEADDACDKEKTNALEEEVKTAKEILLLEKKKLQAQQDQIDQLEEEVIVMQQLRQELEKEKELRKIAEDKLLELLDYEKRLEVQKRENAKTMESKSTQMEVCYDAPTASSGSPHLLGYEGRLRKYQNYIAKLENDNLMLVNELKKFKDLSPRSQEEQAKVLVEKLSQMERNNHLQQKQYETCLDEVANKLVQTLLAQKRLEEECRVLHLRVEQLEQENGTLMELIEEDKEAEIEKTESIKSPNSESSASNLQTRKPSHHPSASSPRKRSSNLNKKSFISSEERKKDSPKSTNGTSSIVKTNSNPEPTKSLVSSPTSPGSKPPPYASKIPSFNTPKPPLVRKKSDMELKPRNEAPSREPSSSELVPNNCKQSSSSRTKLPSSKASSSKRKRLSRTGSPADKDSKQRIKSNHIRWDHHQRKGDVVSPMCQSGELSPIKAFPPVQQVWSFNCEVTTQSPLTGKRVVDSIEAFTDKLCGAGQPSDDFCIKQGSSTSESSTTIEGRTRDEGYSTMSSDLQPDSAADTTISEQEPSATYVVKDLKDCPSDDSVTECLDGSMCSSSDSGFGPLHQVAVIRFNPPEEEQPSRTVNELPKADALSRKLGTVKCKEQIASVKPTVRSSGKAPLCDNFPSDTLKFPADISSKATEISQDVGSLSPSKFSREKKDPNPAIDILNFPKELVNLTTNYRKTWHLGPTNSIYDDKLVFCTRHSYIEDNFFDDKIETAEKATLTEPEEELWREKALAPFIDESIWSLYSSEGDIQVKHFPLEPLLSGEPSLEKLINNCNPCIVVTENVDQQSDSFSPSNAKPSNKSSTVDLDSLSGPPRKFRTSLERVASDSVLYLKDAIYELENSMRRGLKSSKNIPALHQNSGSESEASPTGASGFKPELLKTLEATMSGQNHLAWPSPTRSSSTSSLQSSTSCHVASDDMEDVEMIRTSRKGSQDPDLNSASDVEYENLEHKEYVERWLQKEIVNIPPKTPITTLEPVQEINELSSSPSVRRKTSLPNTGAIPRTPLLHRKRYLSYPTDPPPLLNSPSAPESPIPPTEDPDEDRLDPEAKEFNGDFYTLCSIGSLKSLDHGSPVRSLDKKPTVLVKPTRPVTLAVTAPVPKVPEHHSVPFQISLPKGSSTPKVMKSSPTKIIIRSSNGGEGVLSRKQQWRRDKLAARQNRVKEGCGTAWVHLQANPELSDPNLRINLLDSIKAPSSSSGSSSNDEEENDVLIVQTNSHLHRICKERRQKVKASANNPLYDLRKRTSIMGRRELFYRFGDKEREAIACFDFLEELPSLNNSTPEISTTPPSTLGLSRRDPSKERFSFLSPTTGGATRAHSKLAEKSPFSSYSARRLRLPNLWNQPLSHNMSSSSINSQDCEILDHISLSDSCAESYSSTPESYDDAS